MQTLRIGLLAYLLSLGIADDALGEDWNSFQNGGSTSIVEGVRLPMDPLTKDRGEWSVNLVGYGQSSPITDGEVVYVTSVSGDMKEHLHVLAFDFENGAELWKHDLDNSTLEKNSNYVSRAAPTPVCDSQGIVAFFEGGNVVALTKNGDVRWKRDLVNDYGNISANHGLAASLEQDDTNVFVWVERQEEPYLLALNKATGETAWKSPGLGSTSWSSPRLVPVGDSQHLVLSAVGEVVGVDPKTGERLWTLDGVTGNSTPTPMPLGNGRFLLGATVGRGESRNGRASASNGAVEIQQTPNGGFAAEYRWSAKRATASFGSPIVHLGYAYFVNRSGVVYCLDAENGEEKFAKRIGSSIWATPIAVGENVYFFRKDGVVTILKSGPQFEIVAEQVIWETDTSTDESVGAAKRALERPVLYGVALVKDAFILRRGDLLYRR